MLSLGINYAVYWTEFWGDGHQTENLLCSLFVIGKIIQEILILFGALTLKTYIKNGRRSNCWTSKKFWCMEKVTEEKLKDLGLLVCWKGD